MSYDVFISYASKDKIAADAACAWMEAAGIRCWIAPRDIVPGTSYGEAIIEAIHGLKVMVLVFSSNANASAHIPKEVERAMSSGVAIIPLRIEDVAPGKSLDYFIGSVHWLDAMTPPLEKHLDALVETVRKLLPAKEGGQAASPVQTSGEWQRPAPPAPPAPPVMAPAIPAAQKVEAVPASSSKAIWIGIAAVVAFAVVILAVVMMRGRGNSPSASVQPFPATPSSGPPPANAAPPVASGGVDPVVGCYQWFNNGIVTIHENGTMVGGPFTARWRVVNAAQRSYAFTWPAAVDTVTMAANQQSLNTKNQYGYTNAATRVSGSQGMVGSWSWPGGQLVIISPDGTFLDFSAPSLHGKWNAVDAARGIYSMTWPDPVDSVTLSADGTRVSGSDQYGIAISGVKTQPCSEN